MDLLIKGCLSPDFFTRLLNMFKLVKKAHVGSKSYNFQNIISEATKIWDGRFYNLSIWIYLDDDVNWIYIGYIIHLDIQYIYISNICPIYIQYISNIYPNGYIHWIYIWIFFAPVLMWFAVTGCSVPGLAASGRGELRRQHQRRGAEPGGKS